MSLAKDVEVIITFLPTSHGGRQTPAKSGYRPQFYYDGLDHDAIQTFIDKEFVNPGEIVKAYLTFLHPDLHLGNLCPGKAFLIREGNRIVGYGSIVKVLDLEDSARKYVETFGPSVS